MMTDQRPETPPTVPLPLNTQLPFFAYGSLKAGEPAHDQISGFLADEPLPAAIPGTLWVRDGLPLLELAGAGQVEGFLLSFKTESAEHAYQTICRFEPPKHYCWKESATLLEPSVRANVLVGKELERGRAAHLETNSWTLLDDPVFDSGLSVVRDVIKRDAKRVFDSAPPEHFDWPRFFRLQMAYLLLWSAMERYAALRFGAGLVPMAKIKKFGRHEVFRAALKRAGVSRKDTVCDSRDPEDSFALDASDPLSSILYYYQVRNNLSHRGKGAWADGEIVRKSLMELEAIFDAVLQGHGR